MEKKIEGSGKAKKYRSFLTLSKKNSMKIKKLLSGFNVEDRRILEIGPGEAPLFEDEKKVLFIDPKIFPEMTGQKISGDLKKLPIRERGKFGFIALNEVLPEIENEKESINELISHLTDDGVMLIIERDPIIHEEFSKLKEETIDLVKNKNPKIPEEAKDFILKNINEILPIRTIDPKEIAKLLKEKGFEVEHHQFDFKTSGKEIIASVIAQSSREELYRRRDSKQYPEVPEDLEDWEIDMLASKAYEGLKKGLSGLSKIKQPYYAIIAQKSEEGSIKKGTG